MFVYQINKHLTRRYNERRNCNCENRPPLGSTDEDNPSVVYPINCGYVDVERTAGFSELDKQRVYLLGVDVAVDEYIGELIAVARRRDDPETVWIIAPENISYTIQQIEEMIYFEEQYYDSFVEIVDEELWDAYDENEKLLGFDLKEARQNLYLMGCIMSLSMYIL